MLPLIATTLSIQPITKAELASDTANVQTNEAALTPELSPSKEEKLRQERADKIDAYFRERNMPLEGTGMKMVLESEKNDIDWRLLPAIAVRESTGGKYACKKVKNSVFGYGSCKINFKSIDDSIEIVARSLGGNNPRTAHHYKDKTLEEIIKAYNPPSVIPKYYNQVLSIMNAIEDVPVEKTTELAKA